MHRASPEDRYSSAEAVSSALQPRRLLLKVARSHLTNSEPMCI